MDVPRAHLRLKTVFDAIAEERPEQECLKLYLDALEETASNPNSSNVRDKAEGEMAHFILPGIGVGDVYNLRFVRDHDRLISSDVDLFEVQLLRRGALLTGEEDTPERLLEGAELYITETAARQSSRVHAPKGGAVQIIGVRFPPSFLSSRLGVSTRKLPSELLRFFDHKGERHAVARYVLPDRVSRAIDQVMMTELKGPLRQRYFQAKALECLVEVLGLLQQPLHKTLREGFVTKKPRPYERARDLLQDRFRAPPSLDELAASCGVSRRKLTAGFRQRYGTSPMAYALKLRMEEARRLLDSGEFTVKQVGYRVGYFQAANFTQAYSAFFGHPPRKDRA